MRVLKAQLGGGAGSPVPQSCGALCSSHLLLFWDSQQLSKLRGDRRTLKGRGRRSEVEMGR